MGLSNDLISQFVKITKDNESGKKESTAYGSIVKYNNKTYVKLDGSELLTPVTTTTDVEENERVTVTIKNHTATVTGNISSPSARTDTVKEIDKEVTVIGNKISEFEIVIADKVSTTELDAERAKIEQLQADNVTISGKVTANEADISKLETDNITINEKLTAAEADIDKLSVDNVTISGKVSAAEADIKNIKADNVTISGKVSANEADISKLETDNAVINEKLVANSADIDVLEADYATINGKVSANEASINNLEATMMTSDHAVIKNLQSDVAEIDTLIFGSASGDVIQTSFANAVIAQLGNAQIKSAMIENVTASQITAGDIITNNVRVMSEDGSLVISDETLQISDGTRVRVQIGKDAASDYSINIWDASGNLMFSKGGITDAAIKDAIIRNDMVAANANISASKLDIDSLFTEINNSSKTIKSTKVYLDEKGQTLDAAFTSMSTDVNGIKGTVESQGTQLSVMQGQIANKIWQTDINTTIDKLEIGGRNLIPRQENSSATHNGITVTGTDYVYRIHGTNTKTTPGNYGVGEWMKSNADFLEPGETYTLSTSIPLPPGLYLGWNGENSAGTGVMLMYLHGDGVTKSVTYTIPSNYRRVTHGFFGVDVEKCGTVDVSFRIKLEKGNKATDWTPPPEAVEGEISALSTKYSEVKQTVDGLSTTVAAHTTQISNKADSSTVTTVNNKVSALEQNLDGFKTTVSNTYTTKTEFDNLKIGGRNLWITSSLIDAYDNQQGGYVSSPGMPAHKYLDVFIDTSGNDYLYFQLWNPNKIHNSTYANRVAFFDANKTYISYVRLPYLLNEPYIKLLIPIPATAAYVKLAAVVGTTDGVDNDIKVKFEFGNKATDWTPAPEDVEGEISTVSNKVSTLEQSVDGFKATVSSTYATKSDLDATNSKLPWATEGWVDASAYDPNYWIPFVASGSLPTYGYGHITVTVALNSGTKPSWSTHVGGFSVEFDVEAKASGWGTSIQEAIINRDTYSHCYSSPVSYKQLGYGSKAILYLRGGGKYYVRTSWATTWTGFPDGYTWTSGDYSQSAPAYATRPTPEGYMYGTKTEINQLSDRITANVSETTALGTRMSTVEQKADGLTVSLKNLPFVGRNLIPTAYLQYNGYAPSSTKEYVINAIWAKQLMSTSNTLKLIEPSTEYTISCTFECTSKANGTTLAENRLGFAFYSYSVNSYIGLMPSNISDTINVGDKLTLTKTFKTPATIPTDTYFLGYTRRWTNPESYDGFKVYNLKLEKGSKATDWTPAPEDTIDATKTATNYLNFSNGGLVVGNMTASTLGNNVLIDTDSVDIRNGTTTLASYQANKIELAKNSPSAVIDMCSGTAQFTNKNDVSGIDWYRLGIASRDSIGLETGGEVTMDTHYENAVGDYADGIFRMSSCQPWNMDVHGFEEAYSHLIVRSLIAGIRKEANIGLYPQFGTWIEHKHSAGTAAVVLYGGGGSGDNISEVSKMDLEAEAINAKTSSFKMTTNNSKIYGKDPNGVEKAVFIPQNQYGNTIVGYENYTTGKGNTNLYGQDLNFSSSEAGNVTYRPYYRGNGLTTEGDTINITIRTAGFVTSSGTGVQFTVPLAKPIIGNPTVTASSVNGFQLRCNGYYTHGSSASSYATPSSYSVTTTNGGNNVVITATFSDTTNIINNTVSIGARNNSPIGIYWSGKLTITFG